MKTRTAITNVLIAGLFLFATIGPAGGSAVLASSGEVTQPQAVTAMPAPTLVFAGLDRLSNNLVDPDIFTGNPTLDNDPRLIGAVPDTTGAAGHTHYMQAVNKMIALYRKDGTLIDDSTFAAFWTGSNTGTLCSTGAYHHGQPFVMYDHLAGRWVVVDVAYQNVDDGPYFLCVAVSKPLTAPTTPAVYFTPTYWYYYTLSTDQGSYHYYPDSPKLGLWPDGYYLAADMLDVFNNGYNRTPRGVKVWALNREDLIGGAIGNFRFADFYLGEDLGFEHLVPSNLIGQPPANGTPNYFAAIQPGKFHIWEFHANWNTQLGAEFGLPGTHRPNSTIDTDTSSIWAIGYLVRQVDSTERLDVHGERLMSPLQYRIMDGMASLWATHAVLSDSVTGMRWYEIRHDQSGDPFFYQYGTYQPDSRYRWMGSLAVDRQGNMALGYSVSRDDMDPAIRYAGRLKNDPTGTLAQGEALFERGGFPVYDGSQYDGDGLYDGPWGRQSHMSVDPLDDCIFWYTNMYYGAQSGGTNWRTAIGWFSFPSCKGGETKRISLHTNDTQGNFSSGLDFEMYSVGISANGRYVVFSSEATNLVNGDTNGLRDVFLRDRDTDADGVFDEPGEVKTTRLSNGIGGAQANGASWEVAISGDSNYIAFSSDASNIVLNDGNGARDVFVYKRSTGAIIRASVVDDVGDNNKSGNAQSDQPFLDYDGSIVVFRSYASDLVPSDPDTNTYADIFLRDRDWDSDGIYDEVGFARTIRVSVPDPAVGAAEANHESATPTVSNDGRYIAFASRATNLQNAWPDDVDFNVWDVFLRDRIGPTTTLVSQGLNLADTGDSYTPFISGNSRFVAFASRAFSLFATPLFIETPGDSDADIFVFDRTPPALGFPISYVSVNFFGDEAQNGDSYSPSISADGRYIAFASEANNLDVNLPDLNARRDIFVHDRSLALSGIFDFGLTNRVSLNYLGGEPNEWSFAPVVAQSSNQLHVAYVSEATNLVTNDTNSAWDVFAFNGQRRMHTFLTIPPNIPGAIGQVVYVPVEFDGDDVAIDTTTFSVDIDESCLEFDESAPDAITFFVPPDFIHVWDYDGSDLNGEIDFSIYDQVAPRATIPDGTLLEIRLQVKSACAGAPGSAYNARVGFSGDPPASFGSLGQSILGFTSDGFVRILPAAPGDCNGDGLVDAGDLSALVLEIFDGDDVLPENTPGGSFPGNPVGCNPNQDVVVDAGDLSCTVLIIWGGGTAACMGGAMGPLGSLAPAGDITLRLPVKKPAVPGEQVTLPLRLDPQGQAISSMVFSVDYDQSWLSYASAQFSLPEGYVASAVHDPLDSDGELDVVIYYPGLDAPPLPAQDVVYITFTAGKPEGDFLAVVKSSQDPAASFGSPGGASLPGYLADGSVLLGYLDNFIFLPVTVYK